jgi:hypothetical protein
LVLSWNMERSEEDKTNILSYDSLSV